jgi:uncharacterized membrane protein YphA (DoxX/SURF4 family)
MGLGLFLFIKGALFLHHLSDIPYLFGPHQADLLFSAKASRFYSIAHMIGGLMIASGFLTRLALLCQIPIVLGSMCLVNSQFGSPLGNIELWVSITILSLLMFFMVVGPGRYSIDNKVLRKSTSHPHYN